MDMLTNIEIHGFKSIRSLAALELGRLNVLIGANGAGKSNFISFFRMLHWLTATNGTLEMYVSRAGGANALLFDGAGITPQLSAQLTFQTSTGRNEYAFRLFHAAADTFIFAEEKIRYTPNTFSGTRDWLVLGAGHRETKLNSQAAQGDKTASVILSLLKRCIIHQFHNTSETARIRQKWDINDNRFLKEDGANLAPFLLRLKQFHQQYYVRIVETIRQIMPFFADFVLEPVGNAVLLQWQEVGTDLIFGSHQASDGMLRVMALIALLLQPEAELPILLIIDEPELGLHPYAISILAGLLESISIHTQIIIATQSITLIDHLEPHQLIVVDRTDRQSTFQHLDEERLHDWLVEYSLAELWEKNVLGGRPGL